MTAPATKSRLIGREQPCDLFLDYPDISRQHARLEFARGKARLVDLDTANGTFVNRQRVTGSCEIQPGDTVAFGKQLFLIEADFSLRKIDDRAVVVEARNLVVDVPGRRLLDDVSLTILPTEFVGLMGPAGAGKTTLMKAFNGYTTPTDGAILYDGVDLYANYFRFNRRMGYVPQDDIIHRDLTVREALTYTARLRLPGLGRKAIKARVVSVIERLSLGGLENSQIGSPEKSVLSGGQRKRVNLGMELLADPAVLFLDEPTSGLSAHDALAVMKNLRQIADEGKAILLTIHQPGLEAYRLMNRVVLIGRDPGTRDAGQLVYFGPAYPDAVTFFNPALQREIDAGSEPTPDEILSGLAKRPTREWAARYEASELFTEFVDMRAKRRCEFESHEAAPDYLPPVGDNSIAQWWTLCCRGLRIKIKDRTNTIVLLAQAPIVAVLIVLIFGKDARQRVTDESWQTTTSATTMALFIMVLSSIWFGCSNAAREIVGEWAIYHRERMVNLKLATYIGSKFAILAMLCALQCGILTGVVIWQGGLKSDPLRLFLTLLLMANVGVGIGLLVSAFARTSEVAVGMLPIILIPMIVLGGVMQPLHKMHPTVRLLANVAPSRWGLESVLLLEARSRELGPSAYMGVANSEEANSSARPDFADNYFPPRNRVGTFGSNVVLAAMLVVATCGVLAILRSRDIH